MAFCRKHNRQHTGFGSLSFCSQCEQESLEVEEEIETGDNIAYWATLTEISGDEMCALEGDVFWLVRPKVGNLGHIYKIDISRTKYTVDATGKAATFDNTYIGIPVLEKVL